MVAVKGTRNGEPWHLAASLVDLFAEVDERWPNRGKASDGSIGDDAHAARKSEHNPDTQGVVRAGDITAEGDMAQAIVDAVKADPRAWYVIHHGVIYSRTHGWEARKYEGDPHAHHVHVSVRAGRVGAAPGPWGLAHSSEKAPRIPPTLSRGPGSQAGGLVRVLQRFLGIQEAVYGDATVRAVKHYQREHDLKADGIVGPKTWAVILTALKLPGYNAPKA